MSTETNAESAQDGVQTTSAGESGPPEAVAASQTPDASPDGNESPEAPPKPTPLSEAIQRIATGGTEATSTDDADLDAEQVDPEARLAEATARAEAAERVANQYHAAAQAGIPLDLAGRLQGATVEEMIADAQTLKTHLAPPKGINGSHPFAGDADPSGGSAASGQGFGAALAAIGRRR